MSVRGFALLMVALVGVLVVIEALRPQPLDVRVRLERDGDNPFDAEVFFQALPGWIDQPVESVARPAFEQLDDSTVSDRTYLFLSQTFEPGDAETERLLRFAERGNTVVVAAHELGRSFGRALGDTTGYVGPDRDSDGLYTAFDPSPLFLPEDALAPDHLRLVTPGADSLYVFPVAVQQARLFGMDTTRTEILGTTGEGRYGGYEGVTLVRVRVGEGAVIVSSTPLAFSNAALTGEGDAAAYVGTVLDALPAQPVWWDDYNKPYQAQAETPLRYVLQTPALRWAYLLLIAAGLLYVLFRGRRWQRAIPIVEPPPNAQREFARTVGRLHFVSRDEGKLAQRMARIFRDRLRTTLRIAEPDLSPETAHLAAARAGVPEEEAQGLFRTLARIEREARPDSDTLVRLDARITRFFRHTT